MALTYSQIKQGLDDVAADIVANRNRWQQGRSLITLANTNLGGLTAKYTELVTDINALVAAEPNNDAAKVAKAEKDKLVAEFNALKTSVQTDVTALG